MSIVITRESAAHRKNKDWSEDEKMDREMYHVIVLMNAQGQKVYQCPICKSVSGTLAPQFPKNSKFFAHDRGCPNAGKIPVE